jgi:hypothetical protein
VVLAGAVASGPAAQADDQTGQRAAPYPQLRYFTEIDAAPYAQSDPAGVDLPQRPGYWFVTAQGLRCGIWFRGSFGCSGDIPGGNGIAYIGWITGDARVHYDWTLSSRFPPALGTTGIPPLTFISAGGTNCGTTVDGSTYCEHGAFRMLITSTHTWLNG